MVLPAPPGTQEFPRLKHFPACMEPLMSTKCKEKQSFLQLPETLAELWTRLVDVGLSFINQLFLKGWLVPGCLGLLETHLHSGRGPAVQGSGWDSRHL